MLRAACPIPMDMVWPAKADLIWVLAGISREAGVDLVVTTWEEYPPYPAGPHPCALRVEVNLYYVTRNQRGALIVWLARALAPNYTVVDHSDAVRIDWTIHHIQRLAVPPEIPALQPGTGLPGRRDGPPPDTA